MPVKPQANPISVGHWLLKTEPEAFSIQDLAKAPKRTAYWDGVRNYQARNFLRDSIKQGDKVLFYHSNANPPSIVGIATVVKAGYPDFTAWDPTSHHFDPKSPQSKPLWYMVDIQWAETFSQPLSLEFLRTIPALKKMELLRKGSRLSVQPVTAAEFATIQQLANS